ncbi:MAG TPA: aldehyde dehydrogenase family protein, partial [Arenibaculum sp.]|nr:aldehyde dehydrogenase family protein [Arenibaculum sp.]
MDALSGPLDLLTRSRAAQAAWAARPLADRVAVIARLRRSIGRDPELLAASVGERPERGPGQTLAMEVLPLADACRFLERRAQRLLAPRRLGAAGRPAWLFGTRAEIRREPVGVVLVIAPSNYPLLLAGVQVVQALVAGNAVLAKPAPGCTAPLRALAGLLEAAGLPPEAFTVLGEDVETARSLLSSGIDKVVLTGSAETGRRVLHDLADGLVPAVLELSGNDPVFVLPGADLAMVARALAWGVQLTGGAVCIGPRRVFARPADIAGLEALLAERLRDTAPVPIPPAVQAQLDRLLGEARSAGCRILGPPPAGGRTHALVVAGAGPGLGLLEEDIFAPVISLVPVGDMDEAVTAATACSYALGASIFGPRDEALALAGRIRAGGVTINDLIAPTVDPRLPFGGRGRSGYGTTRGAEGL